MSRRGPGCGGACRSIVPDELASAFPCGGADELEVDVVVAVAVGVVRVLCAAPHATRSAKRLESARVEIFIARPPWKPALTTPPERRWHSGRPTSRGRASHRARCD